MPRLIYFLAHTLLGSPRLVTDDYLPPYVSLSAILLGACVGGIVALGLTVAVTATDEALRVKGEERAKRARRLIYENTGKEVDPPELEKEYKYHLFLSHTWAQGQTEMRVVKNRLQEMMPTVLSLRVFAVGDAACVHERRCTLVRQIVDLGL